jgi:hypothetical protein
LPALVGKDSKSRFTAESSGFDLALSSQVAEAKATLPVVSFA